MKKQNFFLRSLSLSFLLLALGCGKGSNTVTQSVGDIISTDREGLIQFLQSLPVGGGSAAYEKCRIITVSISGVGIGGGGCTSEVRQGEGQFVHELAPNRGGPQKVLEELIWGIRRSSTYSIDRRTRVIRVSPKDGIDWYFDTNYKTLIDHPTRVACHDFTCLESDYWLR